MSTALAAMEAAAMKAMRENGEGIPHGPALPGEKGHSVCRSAERSVFSLLRSSEFLQQQD